MFFLHTCLSLPASLGLTQDLFLWIHAMKAITQWGKTRQLQVHTWGPDRAAFEREMGPQIQGVRLQRVPHCGEPYKYPKCWIFPEIVFLKTFFFLEKQTSKWRATFIQISIPVSPSSKKYAVEDQYSKVCSSFKPSKAEVKYIMFCI